MDLILFDLPNWADWAVIGSLFVAAFLNFIMAYARVEARKGMPLVSRFGIGVGMLIVGGGWLGIMLETGVVHARASTEVGVMIWCVSSLTGNWLKLLRTWRESPNTDQLIEWTMPKP